MAKLKHHLIHSKRRGANLIITDANIHDILRSSVVTVSINSGVAMEGFLHRVPAILFGKSDFYHIAETLTKLDDFPFIFQQAIQRTEGFERFLFWYFRRNCLAVNFKNIHEKIWDCFAKAEFPADRFL